jgi:hypothetical protein
VSSKTRLSFRSLLTAHSSPITCAGEFGVQPVMAALKEQALPKQVMESVFRDRFAAWHGVSSGLYVIQSLFDVALAILLARNK